MQMLVGAFRKVGNFGVYFKGKTKGAIAQMGERQPAGAPVARRSRRFDHAGEKVLIKGP